MDFYKGGKLDGSRGNAPRYPADLVADYDAPQLNPYELARQAEEAAAFTLQPTTNAPRTTTPQQPLF